MGLLDGGLTAVFGAAFSGVYLPGTLHRATRTAKPGGGASKTWTDSPIRYQPDRITEAMRQAEGYTDRDAAFIILQAGVTEPNTDDEFTASSRWAIKSVDADPANTHWIIRASPA